MSAFCVASEGGVLTLSPSPSPSEGEGREMRHRASSMAKVGSTAARDLYVPSPLAGEGQGEGELKHE